MPVPKRVKDTYKKIKTLQIQGAANIAVAAANSLRSAKTAQQLKDSAVLLSKSRPTEPLMRNAIHYVIYRTNEGYSIEEAVSDFTSLHQQNMERIAEIGAKRIPNRDIMTHCHSSTVINILKKAASIGKQFHVYASETRPFFQGRMTAKDLAKAKIPVTVIVDSAQRFFINDMQLAIFGADAITSDGHIINKIGTSQLALCAHEARTQTACAADLLKFDPATAYGLAEPIENRNTAEVWKNPPRGVKVRNPVFDITPPNYINFMITEEGILSPFNIINVVKKKYSWMFERFK